MIGDRIKKLRESHNLKQEDLAKKISVSPSAIGMYERNLREPNNEITLKIANYFDVSVDYLLGKEEMQNNSIYYMCPVYGKISAGLPNWAEECIEGRLPIDVDMMNITNPEECFFLIVSGESMNKEIKNGAYALIRKTDFVNDGDIAVILVGDNEATLKKFTKQGEYIMLEPMSTDESFKTQIYDKNTKVKILGKYIGKMELK